MTLDADQLKRLWATQTDVDIHTVQHGPGEVRDQWRPLDASAAAAAELIASLDAHHQRHAGAMLVSASCH